MCVHMKAALTVEGCDTPTRTPRPVSPRLRHGASEATPLSAVHTYVRMHTHHNTISDSLMFAPAANIARVELWVKKKKNNTSKRNVEN